MNPTRIFLDTNILVYAHDTASVHHTDSATLLTRTFDADIQGVLAEQVLIELYRILTNSVAMVGRSLSPKQARSLIAGTYLSGTFEIIYPSATTIRRTLDLAVSKRITSAKIFDLRLAAVAAETSLDYFATYNLKDFQGVGTLTSVTPTQILSIL
jgi:predicted nucleic acid-binding protein